MTISIEFANKSLQTILGFFSKPPAQAAAFVKSVHAKCGWMKPDRFEKVCDKVVEDLPENGRLPGYKKFILTYNELSKDYNWRALDSASHISCSACGGKEYGWIVVRLYNPKINVTDRFLKPCHECERGHPALNLPLPVGWVVSEEPYTWPPCGTPSDKTTKYLAQMYEGFEDTMVPELAMKQFTDKRMTGQLKMKAKKKDVFMEVLDAAVTGRTEVPADRAPEGSAPADQVEHDTGGDCQEEGDLPPF